jgi:hypothetical protein
VISKKQADFDEEIIINAIKGKRIKKEDCDTIISTLDQQEKPQNNLRIYIAERKKDYVLSFKLNLGSSTLRKQIFSWIHEKMGSLQSDVSLITQYKHLKTAIQE